MPARVHALLVVRPDGRIPADLHLQRTLTALAAQSRPVDALTIVLCGADDELREIAAASGAEGVITTGRTASYAQALRLATHRVSADAVWLLAQDTAPHPAALARLAGALELAPSVAVAAPKLVRWEDAGRIVSLGVSMTRWGRAVGLVDGELDQGQHDGAEDVLGADVRGLLVRGDAWKKLAGIDPGLGGADEGLDLGVRARLAGGRVTLAPTALIDVAGDGVAGTLRGDDFLRSVRREFAQRTAQLHRRLAYAPPAAVALHWLTLLPLALWRSLGHLLGKQPALIFPEWAAAVVVMLQFGSIARVRANIRANRNTGWNRIAPLRVTGRQLRHRLDEEGGDHARRDLHFFTGGGAWLVLAALVASVAVFPALLAWPALGGGALAPLRATVTQLWADAAFGLRPLGWETTGPADPFSAVVAVIGSLSPFEPSRALVVLWLLALPLAALGGWFAATRVTERASLRVVGGIAWMLAPTFLAALVTGRPTGVLVHLLLPWLFAAGAVAHRSWSGAGIASLLLAAIIASAPSLAPALAVLWVLMIILTAMLRGGRGLSRILWLAVPTAVVFLPLIAYRIHTGDLGSVFADPGVPWAGPGSAPEAIDAARRLLLTAGFPTTDPGGWAGLLGDGAPVWWVPLLVAPVLVLAVLAPLTARPIGAGVLLVIAACGLVTAYLAPGVVLSAAGTDAVALWPGAGLSLAWVGLVGAALLSLDLLPGIRPLRLSAAAAVVVALGIVALPALTAGTRGATVLSNGPVTTLPAYVAAEGRAGTGTIVLEPQADGAMAAAVIWGGSATLGGQTTIQAARTDTTPADLATARLTADLMTDSATDVVARLSDHSIAFVILALPADDDAAVSNTRLTAKTALDKREGLDAVGETAKGTLWRVAQDVPARTPSAEQSAQATRITVIHLGTIAIALLLALPTGVTRREARRQPRVVGIAPGERVVL